MNATSCLTDAVAALHAAVWLIKGRVWGWSCVASHAAAVQFNRALLLHLNISPVDTENVHRIERQIQDCGYHRFSESDSYSALALSRSYYVYHAKHSTDPASELFTERDARQHIKWAIGRFDVLICETEDFVNEVVPGERTAFEHFG